MQLLRKNLVFASFLSFALAGFCGASSASALGDITLPGFDD